MVGVVTADEIVRRVKASGLDDVGEPARRRRRDSTKRSSPLYIDPIIKLLVEVRRGRGWTQLDLAQAIAATTASQEDRVSLGSSIIAKYERGHRSPSLARLRVWAQVLDVQIAAWPGPGAEVEST